ncbi:MAG TPA: T9SS type A sorting domain-containing protein [Ignavibacteria bacterium]|nr:T9SS type A sorting domain-containing protein [Ignavibacteria bacterium]
MNNIRICFILAFSIFIIALNNISYSQSENEAEGESSESIFLREQFITERRAGGPGKTLPRDTYDKAVRQKKLIPEDRNIPGSFTTNATWTSVNPTGMFYGVTNNNYISGRTNSIAFHPTDSNIMYIAAAQGGVWKTTDNGLNWIVLTDYLGSIASGDIAIDPNNPNILYYGTGELNYSADSQYGDGIYKSTDAGLSWIQIAPATTVGTRISKIIIDPTNSATVYCAGVSGVFKSTNSGLNWVNNLVLNTTSLNFSPADPQIIYAASGSGPSAIYKTTNGGINWNLSMNGITSSSGRRVQLAISNDNPDYLYASIAGSTGALYGLFRSTDAGVNWTLQNSTTNYMSSQGWYDNAVTVIPGNPNGVIVAGLDVYSSTNGGVTLTKKSTWSTNNTSNFSHADIHYLTYKGSVLYCCSDGGVYRSNNNGDIWTDLNATISTLQFQSADYDPTDITKLYGGTQDNNKQTSTNSGLNWLQRTTGDGGYTIVDPVNTNFVYGQYVNGSIQRSNNYGVSFTNITPSGSSGGLFYNPYEMSPGNHNLVIFGRANVWKTSSVQTATSSSGWTQIGTTADIGGSVSAIGISSTDTGKFYIGTSGGKILITTNNGLNWSTQTGFPYVSDFYVDINNDSVCYATFGGATAGMHVYKTTNSGLNWFSITGNLPNIAVNSISVRTLAPRMIFVGTDLGVYQSTNEGSSWVSFNSGFPNVEVYDLKYKEGPKLLMAATHGRGCFTIDISSLVSVENQNSLSPDGFVLLQNYPNPFNPSTNLEFGISNPGFVSLKVYNSLGMEVATLVNEVKRAGSYKVKFDGSNLSSGIYFYTISSGDFKETKRMMLLK